MSKLIVRTALITLAVLILISSILFGYFAIFYPKPIGEMAESVGSLKVACWAYSKQYDLDSDKIEVEEVNHIYEKYAFELIDSGDYQKATEYVIQAKEDNKIFGNEVLSVVKYYMLEQKKDKEKELSEEISKCIDKIDEKLA